MENIAVHSSTMKEFELQHYTEPKNNLDFLYHDYCEVSLMVSGEDEVFINKETLRNKPKELFTFDAFVAHRVMNIDPANYDRYCLAFMPAFAMQFSTHNLNLLPYFRNNGTETAHKICLSDEQYECLLAMFRRLEGIKDTYGKEVLQKICALEIIVNIAELYHDNICTEGRIPGEYLSKIAPILRHIDQNFLEDLSLDYIASSVHLDKYYMCTILKNVLERRSKTILLKKELVKRRSCCCKIFL